MLIFKISEISLIDRFGRLGFDLYRKARGIDNSPRQVQSHSLNLLEKKNL